MYVGEIVLIADWDMNLREILQNLLNKSKNKLNSKKKNIKYGDQRKEQYANGKLKFKHLWSALKWETQIRIPSR